MYALRVGCGLETRSQVCTLLSIAKLNKARAGAAGELDTDPHSPDVEKSERCLLSNEFALFQGSRCVGPSWMVFICCAYVKEEPVSLRRLRQWALFDP